MALEFFRGVMIGLGIVGLGYNILQSDFFGGLLFGLSYGLLGEFFSLWYCKEYNVTLSK